MLKSLGVIIGRFQTSKITPGHEFLFDEVYKKHENVIVFIGCKPPQQQPDSKNPLDFFSRKMMLLKKYPNLTVLSITDQRSNEDWSYELDKRIDEIKGNFEPILYGSRDSFISSYKGKYSTCELESDIIYSATSVRESIIQKTIESEEFRQGIIYGLSNRVLNGLHGSYVFITQKKDDAIKVLIGKKRGEKDYSFFGTLYNPTIDDSYLKTAKRAVKDSVGSNLEVTNFQFMFDHKLEVWSYASSEDKIHANFFMCDVAWGYPAPSYEYELVEWITPEELETKRMVFEFETIKSYIIETFLDN